MVALGIGANRPGGNSIKLRYVDIDSYDGAALTPRHYLSSTSTISLAAGSDPNLSLVNGQIVTSSAIPAGQTQTANIKEDAGNGVTATYPLVLRGKAVVAYAVKFGANTLRGWGGFDLQYNRGGNPVILLGNSGGAFAISNGKLVLAGTVGAAPPALNSTYILVITDFAGWTAIAVVSRIDNARSIATAAELGAHGAAYGETILLRDGNYTSQANVGPRINAPTGTFTGANHAILTADNALMATVRNFYCAGGFAIRNLRWSSNISAAGAECLRLTGDNYIIENNTFEVASNIYSFGIFKNGAIQNLTIRNNTFRNFVTNIACGINGTQSNNILVDQNTFVNMGEDAMQFANAGNLTVTNNLSIDKLTPAGSQAHPDFLQINTLSTTTTTGPVLGDLIVRNNMIIRGNGGDGGYAGLHGVFAGPWNATGPTYQNIYIENNYFQLSNANAISLVVKDAGGNVAGAVGVNIYIRNNTVVNDPTAPDLIDPTLAGSIPAINVTATLGELIVTGNIAAGTVTTTIGGTATVTNQNNLQNQNSFASHQSIFANPYPNGSGNSGIAATDYAARKTDATTRYQTIGAAVGKGAFASLVTMTPYALLDNFETIGSRTVTSGSAQSLVSPGVLGANALQLDMRGVNFPSLVNPNIGVNDDPATWDLIGFCVDVGMDLNNVSTYSIITRIVTNGQTYIPQIDPQYGNITSNTDFYAYNRGKRWLTYKASRMRVTNWSGAKLTDAGAGSKQVSLQVQNTGNKNAKVKIDALIRPQRVKPAIVLTFDDLNDGQFLKAASAMQSAGVAAGMSYPFVGTGFMCIDLLDTVGKLTTAQAMALKNTYGWTWSIDSGPYDEGLTMFPTRAAAVSQLNTLRDRCIEAGFSTAADAKLFCWSFGAGAYWSGNSAPAHNQVLTPNGTNTISAVNTIVTAGVAPGMIAKGTGASGNPVLLNIQRNGSSGVNLVFDRVIPASAARTFYFCAARRGLSYTANNTAQITVDTTYLVPGMTMFGYGVPDGLTILSVDVEGTSGTVTMSGAVPTVSGGLANFILTDAEFQAGKLEDDLLAAGYTFGRMGSAGGGNGVYTGYGLDPYFAIRCPAASLDDTTAVNGSTTPVDRMFTEIMEAVDNGRDQPCYMHYNSSQNEANFAALMNRLAARCAAGDFDILSLRDWKARVDSRLPIA